MAERFPHLRRMLRAACMAAASLACAQAAASDYPKQPVKFVVPYAVGGLPDTVMRHIGAHLSKRLGNSVVVENRPGGGGVIGGQAMLSNPADGYTFLFSDSAMLSITPRMFKSLPYDVERDFVPVSYVAQAPNFLAVHPSVPADTFEEFIALAKSKPGGLSCGSSGEGTLHHLTLEAMQSAFGIELMHVPYRGSGQSVPALVGGQVDCVLAALPSLSGFVPDKKVKILALAGAKRSSLAPELPAMGEQLEGFDFAFLLGVLARPGVPEEARNRIHEEITQILKDPTLVKSLATIGVEPVGAGPEAYADALKADAARIAKTVEVAGIKAQ